MLAKKWLQNARSIMDKIEDTQMENIQHAAVLMADTIEAGRWVHTFGCGHATIPIEEMYPRIGGFVGFHPMIELPLTFFTNIVGGMSVHNFVFLERVEGYGTEIMKGFNFDARDCMWLFSHTGINAVNIDNKPPQLKRTITTDSVTAILFFDEGLDSATASTAGNYLVNGNTVFLTAAQYKEEKEMPKDGSMSFDYNYNYNQSWCSVSRLTGT